MNLLRTLVLTGLAACLSVGPSLAWERQELGKQIDSLCEARFPDDWPGQTACIDIQWNALKAFSPPNPNDEQSGYLTLYLQCKNSAQSEYDVASIKACFEAKSAELTKQTRAEGERAQFEKLQIQALCHFDGMPPIEVRNNAGDGSHPVMVRVGDNAPNFGKSPGGMVFEWGGVEGADFRIDGYQIMDRRGGPIKILTGNCEAK
ncbi:hypothetical protein [Rhizobium leguminosarum]|uniref:hypothetical protein n=1 Tax=Rhizobium leguminosarum TaxID=384 RepID=UPI001AE2D5B1|nr:hypothetical protein [Rhizobium leguminosarum]MBP2444006.1 hypothetical protein [Rhizobium leguminosarum]